MSLTFKLNNSILPKKTPSFREEKDNQINKILTKIDFEREKTL